jgi:hypothetical protein
LLLQQQIAVVCFLIVKPALFKCKTVFHKIKGKREIAIGGEKNYSLEPKHGENVKALSSPTRSNAAGNIQLTKTHIHVHTVTYTAPW